jgi:hypothetical protein
MTTELRPADLSAILGDLATGPYPEYIDDVLGATERIRHRPRWTYPERWLPHTEVAPAWGSHLPGRAVATAVLLMALVLAAVAFVVASNSRRLPPPYGPAANGAIAFEADGDIFHGDPATGAATPIVSGPAVDAAPQFSPDGTRIAFERALGGGRSEIYVVRTDGGDLTRVTPRPVTLQVADFGRKWERFEFAPDGSVLLLAVLVDRAERIVLARTDGSGMEVLDLGMGATEPSFRPPDGHEVLFIGHGDRGRGVFVVDRAGGFVEPVATVPAGFDLAGASWSPDGSRIAYWAWDTQRSGLTAQTHVVSRDGPGNEQLTAPPGAVWNAHATWSNDGRSIFVVRGFAPGYTDVRGYVVPADGSDPGEEVIPNGKAEIQCCAAWMWSPDDTKLLGRVARPPGAREQLLIVDIASRSIAPAPWSSTSPPSWQRVAP